MKYKDRKHAKRKYKQAFLATVATMTLGVSTLGSTSSAFAAENTANIQKAPSASATDGPVFKRESDGTITVLKDKFFNIEALKAIGSLGGATLKQAWADSQVEGGNFNNTFRTLSMGSAALIPYGGVVISPLIGLLWPEDTTDAKNRLEKLMKDIAKQTHAQIESYDLETLGQKLDKLYKDLQEFENYMNPTGTGGKIAKAPSVGDGPASMRSKAEFIHDDFKALISEAQKPSYKEAEFPIFMVAATAHLNFLHYMELHGKDPEINYDDDGLTKSFLNPQKTAHKDYLKYANEFAKKDLDDSSQIEKTVQDLEKKLPGSLILPGAEVRAPAIKATVLGWSTKLEETLNKSINNIAFKQAANIKSEFTLDQNGRTLYYDLKGQMQTGWKEIGTSFATRHEIDSTNSGDKFSREWLKAQGIKYSWYYFSPTKTDTFEEGEMYVDTTQTLPDGKTYKFNKNGKCLNPDGRALTAYDVGLQDGTYKILSKIDSNKVLDFNQGSLGNSILYDYKGGANQQWTLQYNKDKNAYQIISKKDPNKALSWDQSGGKAYDAKYVFLAGKANDPEQYWTLEDAGDGYFFIHSLKDSNMVLDIAGNNAINETPIKVYPKTGGDNEKFKFEGLK
ncbi:insecticidal delta-endotoxin Cry8Ea1 family protein [Bacillus sp. FDAARGOS_1420]|uniref:insecticidal delta-endotoxin Cry8Ea1 family protein n=1 Tax=unclassified Bacillus (in: firmicutes) TaxID=185979 RepID=UPI001C5A6629|nr:insecticidal delta-endotoxin Cry8Ea1 family protein [Bacillus sp. FDAARGOS_1420]MBW3496815.1 RICIN domain-containing protein [Bacillus sp. FDAARGOS_1420]